MKAMLDARMVAASTQGLAPAAQGVTAPLDRATASSQGVLMKVGETPCTSASLLKSQRPKRLRDMEIRLRSVCRLPCQVLPRFNFAFHAIEIHPPYCIRIEVR